MLIDGTEDVVIPVQFTNPSTGEAQDPSSLPTFRIIGVDGPAQAGTAAYLEDGVISSISTGATTTVNTSAPHLLATGAVVTIANAGGTTGVNGNHVITVVDADTFTFTDVSTSGVYTSGASWHTPGLFGLTLDSTIRAALEVGRNYLALCVGVFSGTPRVKEVRFTRVA